MEKFNKLSLFPVCGNKWVIGCVAFSLTFTRCDCKYFGLEFTGLTVTLAATHYDYERGVGSPKNIKYSYEFQLRILILFLKILTFLSQNYN